MASKHPAVSANDEERTTVDPGALDHWQEEKTIADSPSTETTDVVPDDKPSNRNPNSFGVSSEIVSDVIIVNREALGSDSETVDELTIEERKAAISQMPVAVMVVRTGPHEGQSFTIKKSTTTIGRARDNDIVLVDPSISKHHLKVEFDGLHFYLQDLGSGNGTVINGKDEDDRYQLINRDALELGRSIITFECEAMKAKAPTLKPPAPKPQGKRQKPPPPTVERPTVSMRSSSDHPEFLVDVDEDARTIAGQRPPGPELRADPKSPQRNAKQAASRDLVMPRDPRAAKPRMTMDSPAVPAPKQPPKRAPSSLPTAARPSQPPPVIAPISLEEEEPTTAAAPPRRPVVESRPAPAPVRQPVHPAPSRPVSPSAPPHSAPPMARSGHPSSPSVVYPTAPSQFNRSGAVVALSPRTSHGAGVLKPMPAGSNRKWIIVIAALAMATVAVVTIAAVSGGGESTEPAAGQLAANADAGVTSSSDATPAMVVNSLADASTATAKTIDAAPEVVAKTIDAGTMVSTTKATVTLTSDMIGTSETRLASLPTTGPQVSPLPNTDGDNTDGDKTDGDKTDGDKTDGDKTDGDKTDGDKTDGDKTDGDKTDGDKTDGDKTDEAAEKAAAIAKAKADRAYVQKTKGQANAAYRDRNFKRAASLSRSAAARTTKRDARRLRKRASDLLRLQKLLTGAKKSSAISAFSSYRQAKTLDRRLGKKHQSFLNAQLLRVGPDAARQQMAKGDFAKAAKAVTVSRQVGDRSRTASVMRSLENKAKPKISAGKAAKKRGNKKKARSEYNAALRMLPQQSPLYRQVKELISDL